MKIKVSRKFKDKENNLEIVEAKSVYETTKERGEYLIKKGFGTEIKEKKKSKKESKE